MNHDDDRSSVGDIFGGLTGPVKTVPPAPFARRAATPMPQAVHHFPRRDEVNQLVKACEGVLSS